MLEELDATQRLQLIQFLCSFAWADLEVRDEERAFVRQMVERLELGPEERLQAQGWLESPPPAESIDPTSVPAAHRKLFLEAVEQIVVADGEIAPEERESLELLRELFR